MSEEEKAPSTSAVAAEVMRYYVRKVVDLKLPEIRKMVMAANPQIDPEYAGEWVTKEIKQYENELVFKMNMSCMLVLDYLVSGRIDQLRKFETLFVDLLERTLLKDHDARDMLESVKKELVELIQKASQKVDLPTKDNED